MDYAALHEEINNHPGKLAHDKWSNLHLSYQGIYCTNRKQLLDLLDSPNHNHQLFEELWQNVRPQTVKNAFQSEYARLLHNYIAAGSTLIDHSRRFINDYSDQAFLSGYESGRKKVADTFEHVFLTGMRNYIVHRDIPPIGWQMKITNNYNTDMYEATLNSEKLLEWDKWNGKVRSGLKASLPTIALTPLVIKHGEMIDEFYGWIFEQYHRLHSKEIAEVNALIQQMRGNLPPDISQQ